MYAFKEPTGLQATACPKMPMNIILTWKTIARRCMHNFTRQYRVSGSLYWGVASRGHIFKFYLSLDHFLDMVPELFLTQFIQIRLWNDLHNWAHCEQNFPPLIALKIVLLGPFWFMLFMVMGFPCNFGQLDHPIRQLFGRITKFQNIWLVGQLLTWAGKRITWTRLTTDIGNIDVGCGVWVHIMKGAAIFKSGASWC